MTTQTKALKLALEALKYHTAQTRPIHQTNEAITAIKEALAKPEQKPIAWVYPEGLDALKAGKTWTAYGTRQEPNNTALYLSPQPDIPPYAWVTFTPYGDEDDVWYENPEGQLLEGWTYKPLYDTTPPQRTERPVDCERCNRLEEQAYDLVGKLRVANIKLSMLLPRTWVGLEKSDMPDGADPLFDDPKFIAGMVYAANKLKEKNNG